MTSKVLCCVQLQGGMDGVNLLSPRDAPTVAILQSLRQGAPTAVLDYNLVPQFTGTLTAGSDMVTGITSTTGIAINDKVYGGFNTNILPANRNLRVIAVAANSVQMNGVAYISGTINLYIGNPSRLYSLNETPTSGRNPGLHYSQSFLYDAFNVADNMGNQNLTKAAIVANISPLRKPLYLDGGVRRVVATGQVALNGVDLPLNLTSHNDQQSTVQANTGEGAVEGWGGGIADNFLNELGGINIPLASVSASNLPVFSAGSEARTFSISGNGLLAKIPNYIGNFAYDSTVSAGENTTLIGLFNQAVGLLPANDDISNSANRPNMLAVSFQDVLNEVIEITDIPSSLSFAISGSATVSGIRFAQNMRQLARMILANNPNRGITATRSGTTVTVTTQVSTGVANRTAGSNLVTVTLSDHGLFTSNADTTKLSDSVLVNGTGLTVDNTTGYKITLLASDVNNRFTFTSGSTTEMVNVPVTVQLKHNLNLKNKVFFDAVGFDSASPVDGYPVTVVSSPVSFQVTTTASGAFSGTTLTGKFKLINLTKQVLFAESAIGWDTHNAMNHSELSALDAVMAYFNSLVSRIVDADVVTFISSEFGRTLSTNSTGTDHGWGNNFYVFGKSVRGNRVYGDLMDYTAGGEHVIFNYFMPTTSIYQYGATFAKWMGSSDAQILQLFPDLVNWPELERTLDFLDPL